MQMGGGQFVAVASAGVWKRQAEQAMARLEEKRSAQGLPKGLPLEELNQVDHRDFCLLIEALHALAPLTGRPISQELLDLAEMHPVGDVLPD